MYSFIGDVHGDFDFVNKIARLKPQNQIIQVGDMGIGFDSYTPSFEDNVRFIRGNHDNPNICHCFDEWIRDGFGEITPNGTKIMYIGGAWSIDQQWRLPGKDWWPEEQLSEYDFREIEKKYISFQPDVVVTHTVPHNVMESMFPEYGYIQETRTTYYLQSMFEKHQPLEWIFGHHHVNREFIENNCKFTCIGINSVVDKSF